MLRSIPSRSVLLGFTLVATVACSDGGGSDDGTAGSGGSAGSGGGAGSGGSAGSTGGSSGRLDPAAVDELRAAGADEYIGVAEIMEETTNGNETSFVFDPASGPVCISGDVFRAHIRNTGSDDLLIFLDGGGACWSGFEAECSATADTGIVGGAVLNDEDPDNVFKDYNILFVPYCDGSVFSGDNTVDTGSGTRIHHGQQNLSAALDVALDRLPEPSRVVLGGVSAGGYGTLFGAALTRLAYPNAQLVVYNDSGPGVQKLSDTTNVEARIAEWKFDDLIPDSCTDCDGGRGQLTALIGWMLERDPTLRVGMGSYFEDPVIGNFFLQLTPAEYKSLLLEESGKLVDDYPDRFKRFMLPGTSHVIVQEYPGPTVDGVLLRDWLAGLADDAEPWRDLLGP